MIAFKVVIPARYGSTRLPGKPLRLLAGKSMVLHVCDRAMASGAEEICVATDDERIHSEVSAAGYPVMLTAPDHASGTDRIAEVARKKGWLEDTLVVNLQGDEPMMPADLIRRVAEDLAAHEDASIATLATPITARSDVFDPNQVKVVLDEAGYAAYFSRAPIPWHRDSFTDDRAAGLPESVTYLRHIGLYAYRVGFLRRFVQWPPALIERTESLEQLRALWHRERIHVSVTQRPPPHGVDTPQDVERMERLLASMGVSESF